MGDSDDLRDIIIGIRDEVTNLNGQVSGIRDEVTNLSGQVSGISDEVTNLNGQVSGIRTEMEQRFNSVDRDLHQIKTTVGAIRIETSALIDTVADINKRSTT